MVRRVSPSQFKTLVRQQQQKIERHVRELNREIAKVNAARNRAITEYNNFARRYNAALSRAVNDHNQNVRAHNAQVRSRRQSLAAASRTQRTTTSYASLRTSSLDLNDRFERIERSEVPDDLSMLAEREVASSLSAAKTFADDLETHDDAAPNDESAISVVLEGISPDLHRRWRGAMFALDPANPDAARHVCISMREVLTQMLEILAPDDEVLDTTPDCDLVPSSGKPSRRSKISHLLGRRGVQNDRLGSFFDSDIENIMELFRAFNDGAHGSAGHHDFAKLRAIRARVEGGIMLLAGLGAEA